MKEIKLTRGMVAIVSDKDYAWLNKYKWHAQRTQHNGTWYAARSIRKPTRQHFYMHRVILGVPDNILADHRDGNGLHNYRSNLRPATPSQNNINRKKDRRNTSGYVGVYWSRIRRKWIAQIKTSQKVLNLGGFENIIDAAKARDRGAKKYHGKFAHLNFPNR